MPRNRETKSCSKCAAFKEEHQFSKRMWRLQAEERKCIACARKRSDIGAWTCIACKKSLPREEYSQWLGRRKNKRNQDGLQRCNVCLETCTPREVLQLFRFGGWYRRLPRVSEKSRKEPSMNSRRPRDIDVVTWSRCGQQAQNRELECRAKEARGEGPPSISPEILERLPNEQKERVLEQIGAQRKSLSNS